MNNSRKCKKNISLLIFDYNVYPRQKISEYHVNELKQALESGECFDNIVWDKSGVIIDGFHRITALEKVYGKDCEVEGTEIECKDKAEMILKAVELNSKHGLRLSAWDKARCLYLAKTFKIKEEFMQKALGVPKKRIEALKKRNVEVWDERKKKIKEVQLKRGQEKIAQKKDGYYLTEDEAEMIEGNKTTGLKAEVRIRTLIGDLDLHNFEVTDKNIIIVTELRDLLNDVIDRYYISG